MKQWKNQWACSPVFHGTEALQLLHRQLDTSYRAPEHREELKNIHTLYRKTFRITSLDTPVYLDITADDSYRLYINGQYVTQGPAPSYAFHYYYNHIEISRYLRPGENLIAVHVYYQGLVNRSYCSGDYRQGLRAEILQGETSLIDDRWKCCEEKAYGYSRTIAYDTQFDEQIDYRKMHLGWEQPEFSDADWKDAECREMDHVLFCQPTEPVCTELCSPERIIRTERGMLLDFGKELTGTFAAEISGAAGSKVWIRYGEELLDETHVRYEMRCNCLYEDQVILRDGCTPVELFDYKCFRYVELEAESEMSAENCRVLYRHYPYHRDFDRRKFRDPMLQQIWEICRLAVVNCSQEAFLDCPHREKGQYLGDLTVTAHAFHYISGDDSLFRKALLDFAASTAICPGMMAVAPGHFMQEIADFSLMYPYQLLLYYRLSGDRELLCELLPAAEGIAQYFRQFENGRGMLENVKTKWNLVDWPENLRDGYDFELPQPVVGDGCHNVINALYVGMLQCLEEVRRIAGIAAEERASALTEVYNEVFFDCDRGLYVDAVGSRHSSLHANVFAAFYGLAPENNRIPELIEQKGFSCGVYTAYYVLYALLRMEKKEEAYRLLMNDSEHSWKQMIREGASSAFEAWGKEQKWNTSLCHAWASAPIPVLAEYFPELFETEAV